MAIRDETRMLLESMGRLFEDKSTKQVIDAAETGTFSAELWEAVAETGLPLAALPESAGGADAEWSDLFAALRVAGRFSTPIPLAETMLAAWVAAGSGLDIAEGPMTVGPVRAADKLTLARDGNGWRLSGIASRVPYAQHAARIILIAEGKNGAEMAVALDGTGDAQLSSGKNIANEPRDTLSFTNVRLEADAAAPVTGGISRQALYRRGALARATMMSGALERAMDLAVNYAQERQQFGRPISKFQAVQQNLAVLAGQTAAAVAASNLGIEALGRDPEREEFLIGVAKTRVGEAATLACEIAHQVHGAIGFTKEYALQLSTRRLWSWREEFGSDPEWAAKVGTYICRRGADELWPTLTAA
jgi:acyl-CoA dehydrogenase